MCLRIFLTCYTCQKEQSWDFLDPLLMYIKVELVLCIHLHIFINFNNLMSNLFI